MHLGEYGEPDREHRKGIARAANAKLLSDKSTFMDVYTIKRAKAHWMERVAGSEGCWNERERFRVHSSIKAERTFAGRRLPTPQPELMNAWPCILFGATFIVLLHLHEWSNR